MIPTIFLVLYPENTACVSAYIKFGLQLCTPISLEFYSLPEARSDVDVPLIVITQADIASDLRDIDVSLREELNDYKRAGIIVIPTDAYIACGKESVIENTVWASQLKKSITAILDEGMPAKMLFYIQQEG